MAAAVQDVAFDQIVEAINDPVLVFRPDARGPRVEYVNPAYEAHSRRTRSDLLGASAGSLLARVHPEDRHTLDEALAHGRPCEVRLAPTDPDQAPDVRMRLVPVAGAWAAILRDQKALREIEAAWMGRATQDMLTGFLNREAWTEQAQRHFDTSVRYHRPLAVVVMDLDHFKQVNDTHGHAVGDAVLQAVGHACHGAVRRVDVLGRIGGEELALVAPETGIAGASTLAVRMSNAVRRLRVPTADGVVCVTMSAGVAERSAGDDDLASLLARADGAMYRAKHDGRDRVVVA